MMTPNQVSKRRAEWKQRAYRRGCMHVVLEMECSEQGYVTGNYVCNFCGELIEQQSSVASKRFPWREYTSRS